VSKAWVIVPAFVAAVFFAALFLSLYPVVLCRALFGVWPWQRKDAWEWTEKYCASVFGSRVRPWPGGQDE
jgi:hypothetical protein